MSKAGQQKRNSIFCGDCIEWLKKVPDNSIDLCYIDPPFFSNKQHEIIWGNGYELRSFNDRWKGGINAYIEWMEQRVKLIHRTLKPTGSIFLHCDWRASHRLRVMLDEVFGEKNFVNEIICMADLTGRPPEKYLQTDTQTVFWYSKSKSYKSVESQMRKKTYISKTSDHNYKTYSSGVIGYDLPKGDYAEETLIKKEKEGLAFKNKKGNWRVIKQLVEEGDYLVRDDKMINLWDDLPRMAHLKAEKLDYPTQKPEKLLERIIACSTNEGDTVLDCFGGGGTTAAVATKLGRQFITGDVSPVAMKMIIFRLRELDPCPIYDTYGVPRAERTWREMKGHEFAEGLCRLQGWECNHKKSGDDGIDGWCDHGRVPIQIKNSTKKIGINPIKNFYASLGKAQEGIFVAWSFTRTAEEFRALVEREEDKKIVFMTPVEILGELLITDEKEEEINELWKKRQDNITKLRSKKKRSNKAA